MNKDKNEIALKNMDLVKQIVEEYDIKSSFISKEDLFQQGFIGLIDAVNSYSEEINFNFLEYASFYIRFSISNSLVKKNNKILDINNNNSKIINIDDLTSYLEMMNKRNANVLKMYFGLNNNSFDISYIAHVNHIDTINLGRVLKRSLEELKKLIEEENLKLIVPPYKKDDNIYTYYSIYSREDINLAELLLTESQEKLQKLRFDKTLVTSDIKRRYLSEVKPRMIHHLIELERFSDSKDEYMEFQLAKLNKCKKKAR